MPVSVHVGIPLITFRVDKKDLCQESRWFQTELQNKSDQEERHVWLPQHHALTFNAYLNRRRCRRIFLHYKSHEDPAEADTLNVLIEAYAIGHTLEDSEFKDAITDTIVTMLCSPVYTPTQHGINSPTATACARTIARSTARRLLVHTMVPFTAMWKTLEEMDDPPLLAGPIDKSMTWVIEVTIYAAARWAFHEHRRGEYWCYRNQRHIAPLAELCF